MESMLQTPIGPLPPALATKVLAYCEAFCSAEDERYLWFAAHAAFPVALTPDLAYKIWMNFRKDEQEKPESLRIPWIAVSDLLLSPLYRPTGRDIYEMHPDLRAALLQYLKAHSHFGPRRHDLLARFLKFYLRENRPRIPTQAFLEAQEFVCNAHLEPQRAAEQLLALWNRQADKTRFRQLLSWSEQEVQLEGPTAHDKAEANPLGVAVQLVKGVQQFQAGNREEAVAILRGLKGIASRVKQEGIAVEMPQGVLEVLPAEFFGETPVVGEERGAAVATQYAKIHLLTPGEEDQAAIAKSLLGALGNDITPIKTGPLTCYQLVVKEGLIDRNQWIFQVWQFSESIPDILDRFLITQGGLYVVLLPTDSGDLGGYLEKWQNRLQTQVGPERVIFLAPEKHRGKFPEKFVIWGQALLHLHSLATDLKQDKNRIKKPDSQVFPEKGAHEKCQSLFRSPQSGDLPYILTSENSQFPELNTAGFIRWFEGLPLAFLGPQEWVSKMVLLLSQAKRDLGMLFLSDDDQLKKDIYYPLVRQLAVEQTKDGLFLVPATFEQEQRYYYYDYYTYETTYIQLQFDYLPSNFHFGLAEWLIRTQEAVLLANRSPLAFGLRGRFVQLNLISKQIMEIVISEPDDSEPSYLKKAKESHKERLSVQQFNSLQKILRQNWKQLDEQRSNFVDRGSLVSKLIMGINVCISQYPYPITFTSKTLHIPAHATPALDMVFIKGGTFTMGDVMGDNEFDDELPLHEVSLDSFRMGRFAVTFEEYDAFCEATEREKPNDRGWGRGRMPVINVSWYDAIEYCNWLSEIWGMGKAYVIDKQKFDSNNTNKYDKHKWLVTFNPHASGFRLPTEAQWEYGARQGGKKVRFGNGKDYADPKEINFNVSDYTKRNQYSNVGGYRKKTVLVGSLNSPNALGLHDMSGNVWEWCWDWFGEYSSNAQINPVGPHRGSHRVSRGGGWINNLRNCRVSNRVNWNPNNRSDNIGFRLVLPPVSSE